MTDIQLRDLILAGAANLFLKRGYAAVSMRMIASEVYVTTGSLYYYFKDKDEIVREILDTGHRRVHEEVRSAIESLGDTASKVSKIKVGIRAHLAAVFEKDSFPAANIRIFSHVPDHLKRLVRPGRRAYEKFWYQLLVDDNGDEAAMVDAQHLTMFLLGAANWTIEWYRPGRDSLDDIAADLARTFVLASSRAESPLDMPA
nr:TetR/AcrR family transcriptional regulator [Sphingomonas sp. Y57]